MGNKQAEFAGEPLHVSVAMCTYNGSAFLGEQLDSIAIQTLQPCELIVCDDRSTDDTTTILQAFARRVSFPMRIFINEENLGTTRNFAKALRLCTGEFVALCDQDDVWSKVKLERLVGLLEADSQALGAFSDASILDSESRMMEGSLWQRFRFGTSKLEAFRHDPATLLLKHDIVTGATLMIRRSVLDLFGSIPTCWLQDGWLTWMIILNGRIVLTPEKLTGYRLHAAQQVGTGSMALAERIESIRFAERDRYEKVAQQCEAVINFIQTRNPQQAEITEKLVAKARFMRNRARLGSGMAGKLWFIVTNVGNYERYARGLRSMRKDLVL